MKPDGPADTSLGLEPNPTETSLATEETHPEASSDFSDIYDVQTRAAGPGGALPLMADNLLNSPSGDVFGLTQNAGMGWRVEEVMRPPFLILSTQGGLRERDGRPVALGYHTGHWELDELVRVAARTLDAAGALALRGVLLRPVRRADAGHDGHVRQPALPQRRRGGAAPPHPLLAAGARRLGRRHLRQGASRHDDGPGGHAPPAGRRRAGRRDAAARRRVRTQEKFRRSARVSRTGWSRSRRLRRSVAAPAPPRAAAASFWAPPPPRRSSRRRSGWRCRTRRSRPRGARCGATGRGGRRRRSSRKKSAASRAGRC